MTTPEAQEAVSQFVKGLLAKDAQDHWFSTRLRESSIVRKLQHEWDCGRIVPAQNWVRAVWGINSLAISTHAFTLQWDILKFEPTQPQIASRFLPALSNPATPRATSPSPETRQITIQPTAAAEEEANELEDVYDIPYSTDRTTDLHEQMKDRQALQEARLRLALAKLKMERLRNGYFSKYGEAYSEDEDSDLSESDSEEEH